MDTHGIRPGPEDEFARREQDARQGDLAAVHALIPGRERRHELIHQPVRALFPRAFVAIAVQEHALLGDDEPRAPFVRWNCTVASDTEILVSSRYIS